MSGIGTPAIASTSTVSSVNIVDGSNSTIKATVSSFTNAKALAVEIVDASGNQITSFGGGTQYVDGTTQATPTGNVIMAKSGANVITSLSAVSMNSLNGLIVDVESTGITHSDATSNTRYGFMYQANKIFVPVYPYGFNGTTWDRLYTVGTGILKVGLNDGSGNSLTSTTNALDVNIKSGSIPTGTNNIGNVGMAQPTATTGTITANGQTVSATVINYPSLTVSINGTYGSVAIAFEVSDDGGATWYPCQVSQVDSSSVVTASGTLSNTSRAWDANTVGMTTFRVRATAYTSGTANIRISPVADSINSDLPVTLVANNIPVTSPLGVVGPIASGGVDAGNPVKIGGVFNTTQPTVTNGQRVDAQMTARGAQIVATGVDAFNVAQATASNLNATVVGTGTFAVQATLAAETTKVIGTVRNIGNAGAVMDGVVTAATSPANGLMQLGIFNTTEPSPTTGQSVGIQLDSKGRQRMVLMDAAGNTRGANINASNQLSVSVDNSNVSTNVAQMNGVAVTMGNGIAGTGVQRVAIASDNTVLPGVGAGATGSAVPANASYGGLLAQTANPTAATAGNLVGALSDKLGKQVVVGSIRDLKVNQITTITSSTAETTVLTAVASTFLDVYGVIVVNSSATAANVSFKDSTAGTTRFNIYVPAGETRGFMLPESGAVTQATVNNNWTATSSASVASLIITMLAVKNI